MYLEREHVVTLQDVDESGMLKPDALFWEMQQIAGEHSTLLGCGREQLVAAKGIVWMLLRARLRMERYPKAGETLRLCTWPGVTTRTAYPRYFEFFQEDGKRIGCASSIWVLVNLQSRKLVLPRAADIGLYGNGELQPPLEDPEHFHADLQGSVAKSRDVCYADLDENGHVNNTRYIAWLVDAIPEPWKQGCLRELNVHYASEILPSEHVMIQVAPHENGEFTAQCHVGERLAFEAQGKMDRMEGE